MSVRFTPPGGPELRLPKRILLISDQRSLRTGALLIAEVNGVFAGYAACWIEHDGNIAETDDSNHFGYVADTYVVPEFRGRGVVSRLLETAESHMREQGVLRMRIWTLANNTSAKRAYEAYGFEPYEVVIEKILRR
jgi:ribosomal protein S18 acetylase RimI-like enzyme